MEFKVAKQKKDKIIEMLQDVPNNAYHVSICLNREEKGLDVVIKYRTIRFVRLSKEF